MALKDIATIVALILGPVFAVGLSLWSAHRAQMRNQQLYVFQTLMAYRLDPFNLERIKALALIDLAFYKADEVRAKWKEYYEALHSPIYKDGQNDGLNVWRRKQNEMLAEMAQSLGYAKEIKYEEIERAYAPMLFITNAVTNQKASAEWLRILESSENFGTPRKLDGG